MATRQETAWLSRYRSRADFWTLISFAAIGLFVALLIYPLLRLAIPSLAPGDGDEQSFVSVYGSLFSDPYYRASLINSAILSICTTLLAGALGTTVAYLVARYDLRGKLFIRAAIVLTFVSPPFIGAYSWVLLLGNNGVITSALRTIGIHVPSIYGWTGLILVLTLQGFPFVFLLVSAGLKSVDQSVEDAAINLGTKPIRVVFKVILPLIIPSLSTGALLVFVTAFTDFSTPSIIGQNINVFPRVVYSEFVNEMAGNYRLASALSVVMLLVTVGALVFQRWFARRHAYGQETVRPLAVKRASKRFRACAEAFVYCAVGIACLPLLVVVISSFLKTNKSRIVWEFTLDGYAHAPRVWESLMNTLYLTTIATILCVAIGSLIGYIVARRRGTSAAAIDLLSMMPYAVSGVVLAIAFSLAFGGSPFFMAGTPVILILAYLIRRLPYSIRATTGALAQLGPQTEEAAINLGVPPARTFLKVTVPIIAPAIMSGAMLSWATIIREFNATVILYGPNTGTMSVELFKQVLSGNFGNASVIGTLLIAISLVPILVLFVILGKDEEYLA